MGTESDHCYASSFGGHYGSTLSIDKNIAGWPCARRFAVANHSVGVDVGRILAVIASTT